MKIRALLAAIVLVLGCGFCSLSFAWDVTVHNPTPYFVQVEIYTTVFTSEILESTIITKNSSHTFKTGNWCPSGFKGNFMPGARIASTSILGHETELFSAGCWNSSWQICRKRGNEGDEIKDNDYGFCKQ